MLEVKGEHGERLWKVDAARQLNPAIIVGHAIQPGWPYLTWDLDEVVGAMCNACRDLHLGYFDDFAKESEALWMPVYVGNSVANAWRRGELLGAVKSGGRRVDA